MKKALKIANIISIILFAVSLIMWLIDDKYLFYLFLFCMLTQLLSLSKIIFYK